MPTQANSTTVRGIDYAETFRFTEIFRAFGIATQPGKLMLGLLLVVAMFVSSLVLDGLFGGQSVLPGEFQAFVESDNLAEFDAWRQNRNATMLAELRAELAHLNVDWSDTDTPLKTAQQAIDAHYRGLSKAAIDDEARSAFAELWARDVRSIEALRPVGVFRTVLNEKMNAFSDLVDSVTHLRFGWRQFNPAESIDRQTLIGSVRTLLFELPAWLWHGHAVFMVVWMVVFVVIWSLFGGAISRMTVVDAATTDRPGAFEAMAFARQRWGQYIIAPLMPPLIVGLFLLLLALVGLAYHVPILNIVAGVLFAVAIPIGFAAAFFLVGWVGAVHMMYPAISAEGTDAFDALSRSYSYVIGRPWRFICYTVIALVYGAVTYLFIGLFVFLALALAQGGTALWAGQFDSIFPPPQLGQLRYSPDADVLGPTERIAATVISIWVHLTIGLVAAYAVSYYFSAYSTIYLLLRRCCDGVSVTEVYAEVTPTAPSVATREKIESAGQGEPNDPPPLTQADSE